MPESVLAVGDKVHIMTRRLFADDVHPHFVGEIAAVSGPLFKARGYVFVFDSASNSYLKHPALRTRLFSLSDAELDLLEKIMERHHEYHKPPLQLEP